jgi:ATPase family AAA domain-containing protein 2
MQEEDLQTTGDFGTPEDTDLNATSTYPNSGPEDQPDWTRETPYNLLKIRLPAMVETRRTRNTNRLTSGSEYSPPPDEAPKIEEEEEPEEPPEFTSNSRGRKIQKKSYVESSEGEEEFVPAARTATRGAPRRRISEEDEDELQPRRTRSTRSRSAGNLPDFIASEDDQADLLDDSPNQKRRLRSSRSATAPKPPAQSSNVRRSGRNNKKTKEEEADWNDDGEHSSHGTADAEGSSDDEMETDLHELGNPPEPSPEPEDDNDGKPYGLRVRAKINYAIPPPIEDMKKPPKAPGRGGVRGGPKKGRSLGWSASGAELGRWMGMGNDDSVRLSTLPHVKAL